MEKMDHNSTANSNLPETKTSVTEGSNIISSSTAILFCTTKGLHIRTPTIIHNDANVTDRYQIKFCDLEQWSSKRAESVNLVDTQVVRQQASVRVAADKMTLDSNSNTKKSGLLEHPQPTGVFTKVYARFDVK